MSTPACDCANGGECRCARLSFLLHSGDRGSQISACVCRAPSAAQSECGCNEESVALVGNKWREKWEPSVEFIVSGMTCQSCARSIESRLLRDGRVEAVMVRVREGQVLIQTVPGIHVSPAVHDELAAAIDEIGFDVQKQSDQAATAIAEKHAACDISKVPVPRNEGISERIPIPAKPTTTTLEVLGMTCSACTSAIESFVSGKPGVTSVRVTLATNRAVIEHDANSVTVAELEAMITDMGYDARVVTDEDAGAVTVSIEGMTCASCVAAVESALLQLRGVHTASVNLMAGNGRITFDPDKTGVRAILACINDLGYDATLQRAGGARESPAEARRREVAGWKRLLLIGLVPTIPIFLLSMVLPNIDMAVKDALMTDVVSGLSASHLVMLILDTFVQFWVGRRFYVGAYKALRHGFANMDVLIVIGTTTAYVASIINIAVQMANPEFKGTDYFEVSALLICFVLLGKYLESAARGRTSEALYKLMDLQTKTATLVRVDANGAPTEDEEEVEVDMLQRGDVVKILPGAKVSADGVVLQGQTYVDESMVTGESMPVRKTVGSTVIGGTVNHKGLIYVRATKVGADAMLAQIVRLVEEAQTSKAPIQAIADKISGVFVPVVVGISLVTFAVWLGVSYTVLPEDWLPDGASRFVFSLLFFITTIVIACPCALGLATPTAVMVGTGLGAKEGILIKGGEPLQVASSVTAVIFDKTGTLTFGKPVVTDVYTFTSTISLAELARVVGRAESGSEHPLGQAILAYCREEGPLDGGCADFEAVPGRGLRCTIDTMRVCIGNEAWMVDNGLVVIDAVRAAMRVLQAEGKTAMLVGIDGAVVGLFAVADTIRPEAREITRMLQARGVEVWMVTGDNARTAQAIAGYAGITNVYADVLPGQKAEKVRELQSQGKVVAMVGDGINDSPALTQANVGIAIGGGTDIAMEAADIVLMKSNLYDVVAAMDISRATYTRIKLNFLFAFGYNVAAIPIAAGVFYPLIKTALPPWAAGLAMALSSVSVVLSSVHLKRYRPPRPASYQQAMRRMSDGDNDARLPVHSVHRSSIVLDFPSPTHALSPMAPLGEARDAATETAPTTEARAEPSVAPRGASPVPVAPVAPVAAATTTIIASMPPASPKVRKEVIPLDAPLSPVVLPEMFGSLAMDTVV